MIVACPNCQSKYNLPEAKIAPTGSKVRCAKCQHVFTVKPPAPPAPPADDFDAELAGLGAVQAPAPAAAPRTEPEAPAAPLATVSTSVNPPRHATLPLRRPAAALYAALTSPPAAHRRARAAPGAGGDYSTRATTARSTSTRASEPAAL